jgi:hypothetical protein
MQQIPPRALLLLEFLQPLSTTGFILLFREEVPMPKNRRKLQPLQIEQVFLNDNLSENER